MNGFVKGAANAQTSWPANMPMPPVPSSGSDNDTEAHEALLAGTDTRTVEKPLTKWELLNVKYNDEVLDGLLRQHVPTRPSMHHNEAGEWVQKNVVCQVCGELFPCLTADLALSVFKLRQESKRP